MVYSNHASLNNADKISDRSSHWNKNGHIVSMEVNMMSNPRTCTWTSSAYPGASVVANIDALGDTTMYPNVWNSNSRMAYTLIGISDP